MSRLNCRSCAPFLAVLLALSLAGCASTQTARTSDAPLMQRQTQVDEAYVGYVNTVAKQRGTRVVWVNPPTKTIVTPIAASH